MNQFSKFFVWVSRSQAGPFFALAVIVVFFAIFDFFRGSGTFLSFTNIRMMSASAALIAIPALGMTMIIISGGIDLSAGTALTLCGTTMAVALNALPMTSEEPWFSTYVFGVFMLTVLVGCVCGVVNGAIISLSKVVPFIITLGTMSIFLGIGQIVSGQSTVSVASDYQPGWLGMGYTGPVAEKYYLVPYVPTSVILCVVLAILLTAVLRYTIFGRNIYAVGSNESTARLCGISVPWTILSVYCLAGVYVAIGGVATLANNSKTVNPTEGQGKELEIIAAVVLGGGSLTGGRGSAIGTVIGAMIFVVISNGCTMLGISSTYTHIVIGCVIIVAVVLDQLRQRSLTSA